MHLTSPITDEELIELTAAALYSAAALDHNKRDEAPWPSYEQIAEQSRVPYRKQAERLTELNLILVPVGRIMALQTALVELDAEVKCLRTAVASANKAGSTKRPAVKAAAHE